MIHWFHFDLVRDVLRVSRRKVHNESLLYFKEDRNNVAFFIGKTRLRTPIKQVVFSFNYSRTWNPRSLSQQQTKHSATPPTQQIFLPPRIWVVTWPAASRVFLPTTKGGSEERPWERGCCVQCLFFAHTLCMNYLPKRSYFVQFLSTE